MAQAASKFAENVSPLFQEIVDEIAQPDDDAPIGFHEFISKSLRHAAHFTVPWRRLIKTSFDASTGRVLVVRQDDDGSESSFAFEHRNQEVPRDLMRLRFDREYNDALRDAMFPVMYKHREELLPKYREIYGDRLEEYAYEMAREARARAIRDLEEDPAKVDRATRELLEHILPYFSGIGNVRESYPKLFI